ncbi:MAG: type II secretion system protein GspD [Planctomycetes bacterium]|nr:type II secretion system protein GspD [Planctomycetota bacterium]
MITIPARAICIFILPAVAACRVTHGPERPAGIDAARDRAESATPSVILPVDEPETASRPAAESTRVVFDKLQNEGARDPREIPADVLAVVPADRKITLEVADATATELARMLGHACELNVMVDDAMEKHGSLELKDISARDAFRAFARRFDVRVERQGDVLLMSDSHKSRRVSKVLHSTISDLGQLEEKLKPLVGEDGTFTISQQARTVYVEAGEERVAQVEQLLANLALEERQVVIEARIFEIVFDDRLEFGVSHDHLFDVGDSTMHVLQTLLPQSNNFGITAANRPGTITSTMQALRTLGTIELLSSPRIATLNGKDATIQVIQEVPYVQTTNTVSQTNAGGSTSTFQQVEFKEAGITLKVKPAILNDGSVRLDVNTTVSQVSGYFQSVPIIDKRTLQSIVFLSDGGTIFLGGLMQRNVVDNEKKVPILGDIPIIGYLFKSIDQTVKRRELLMLLTTRVVQNAADERIANEYRLRYSNEKGAIEDKRGGTRVSGGDVPDAK